MANRLERIAQGLLRPINPYGTILLGALTFVWGFWIINPWWTVFTQAQVYSKIDYFPEWAWGTWSTLCGALIIAALFSNYFRWLSVFLGFAIWHWSMVAIFLWMGDWQNTAGLTYSFIAIYCMYSWLNIKVNYVKNGIAH